MRDLQPRSIRGMLAIVIVVGCAGIGLLTLYFTTDVNPRHFVSDPAETALLPEYTGSLSYAAIVVLWTSAVIAAVCARYGSALTAARRRFIWSIAIVNGALALDDLCMLHEFVGLRLAIAAGAANVGESRQVMEVVAFAAMIAAGVWWFLRMRSHILDSPWLLLLFGIAGFASSVAVDLGTSAWAGFALLELRVITTVANFEELLKY